MQTVTDEIKNFLANSSGIRKMFEAGIELRKKYGDDKVYDFSLGNPNVPTPDFVRAAAVDILNTWEPNRIHGYTVAPGAPEVRTAVARSLSRRFGMDYEGKNIFMTAGAAAAITICFKALFEAGDEYITFAPFFPEYRAFVESVGGRLVVVPARTEDFQIDFAAFERLLTPHTKAVIVNSPNNPSGAVYSEATIKELAAILTRKEKEYGHPIFIIADEPYREIAFEGYEVPYIPKYYPNTLVCYSYSKSFSLPGERIGYIAVPDSVADFGQVFGAIAGAARVLTHVNAPALWQYVIARCVDEPANIETYVTNGQLLYQGLVDAGFTCVKPQGAFYLFPKCLEEDDAAFCERAKKYDLLLVPGADFGCPGYFRVAYCIKTETIRRSLPLFKKLAAEYQK